MKLREFNFNKLKNTLSHVNLCVKDGKRIYEECSIDETLRSLPRELADREIEEMRRFFNTIVIELEVMKDG